MIEIDGARYVEHGDVVDMQVHRGGGYNDPDESIHTGGAWVTKTGIVAVKRRAYPDSRPAYDDPGNVDGDVRTARGTPSICWVYFFDGDMQATDTRADKRGYPDGPKTCLRKATAEDWGRVKLLSADIL